jgi:hypothetical protein
MVLDQADLVEKVVSCWLLPLDVDKDAYICVSLDAEWNVSRRVGVSILQLACHLDSNHIYIIPVCMFFFLKKLYLIYIK